MLDALSKCLILNTCWSDSLYLRYFAVKTVIGAILYRADTENALLINIDEVHDRTAIIMIVHSVFLMDEASMINNQLVTIISEGLKYITHVNEDFGGCAVIFFGDMAQLPPANAVTEGLFFQNPAITYSTIFCLRTPKRQDANDQDFIVLLHKIRLNSFDQDVVNYIGQPRASQLS